MSNELNWSTQSRTEIARAKKALQDVKEAQGRQKLVRVDHFTQLCLPADMSADEVQNRVERYKEARQ